MDWMDEVLDGKPLEAEMWKIGYIENLVHRHIYFYIQNRTEILNSLIDL